MSPGRDLLAIRNERVKLAASFVNALALGLIGFALLRPLTEDIALLSGASALWTLASLGLHGLSHYILGYLRTERRDDGL